MSFTGLRNWSRLLLRRQSLALFALLGGYWGLLSLAFALRDPGPAAPEPQASREPGLFVVPAGYSSPAELAAPVAPPDVVRLKSAFEQAGRATTGPAALGRTLALLAVGCDNAEAIPDYTSTFVRRERIDGLLNDWETISMKLRHKPLSLYLRWTEGPETGRELVYAADKNDGCMIVHPGGWKGKFLPPLKLKLDGTVAKNSSRHPVTDLGIVAIGRRIIARRAPDVARGTGFRCTLDESAEIEGRAALRCEILFDTQTVDGLYRKSVYYIDREMLIPLALRNYAWPDTPDVPGEKLDDETVLEDYLFTNIRFRAQLADSDFDTTNEQYHFRR